LVKTDTTEQFISDCIKARIHTLLEFLHRSRKWYIFFHNKASR